MDKPFLSVAPDAVEQRRIHARRPLHCPAKLLLASKRIMDLRIVNISAGGLGVIAPENLAVGTNCQLRFDLPQVPTGQVTMYLSAMVMNSVFSSREDGFKLGLRFVNPTEDSASRIERFVHG